MSLNVIRTLVLTGSAFAVDSPAPQHPPSLKTSRTSHHECRAGSGKHASRRSDPIVGSGSNSAPNPPRPHIYDPHLKGLNAHRTGFRKDDLRHSVASDDGRTECRSGLKRNGAVWTVIHSRPETRNAMGPSERRLPPQGIPHLRCRTNPPAWPYSGAKAAPFAPAGTSSTPQPSQGAEALDPFEYPDEGELPMAAMGPSRLELSKPVIAAVAGPAVAGGMELALWADIRGDGGDRLHGCLLPSLGGFRSSTAAPCACPGWWGRVAPWTSS